MYLLVNWNNGIFCHLLLSLIGARRFVTLDFGRPILLTDVLIPTCGDLASLSIDIWTLGEEVDGRRLVVATDISTHSLILHDLIPPPVCRFMKVKYFKTANSMFLTSYERYLDTELKSITAFLNTLLRTLLQMDVYVYLCFCFLFFCFLISDHCHWTLWKYKCQSQNPIRILLRSYVYLALGEWAEVNAWSFKGRGWICKPTRNWSAFSNDGCSTGRYTVQVIRKLQFI